MTFDAFDVVVVPFPFTDKTTTKRRPALVLSDARAFNQQVGHAVLAMITSAKNSDWPLDTEIEDLDVSGKGRQVDITTPNALHPAIRRKIAEDVDL